MKTSFQGIKDKPLIPASKRLPEFTFKALIISIILAVVLAASNAYLALKIGMTISASIPASVLAIGMLKFFKNNNVLECNIIQTAASAGEGVAAAVAFVLPAMVILRIWHGFSWLETGIITILGGLLGVMFSIPLRRVMLNMPTLRYPEGTAIGNVLRASTKGGAHLKYLVLGGATGALISFCQLGIKIIASNIQLFLVTSRTVLGLAIGFAPATLAAGFIIGIEAGISIFVGVVLGWLIALPIIGLIYGLPSAHSHYEIVIKLWSHYLRFVGVGMMLVGGVWTLLRLLKPLIQGLKSSFQHMSKNIMSSAHLVRTERDIPMVTVLISTAAIAALLCLFIWHAVHEVEFYYSAHFIITAVFCSIVYVLVVGFILAAICAYFTGIVGSSNNPLSGLLITGILLLGVIYLLLFDIHGMQELERVTGLVILITAIIATTAAISNENLQDLKAGKMVGATPWKQQVMLCLGVIVSAVIIGPVLDMLFRAYGIGGIFPRKGMDVTQMLAAPQASLMAAVAQGVLTLKLPWGMVALGGGLAVIIIIADEYLRRHNKRLPVLAVGLGIYLPPSVNIPITIGGIMHYLAKRKTKDQTMRAGILLASGLVAGSALMGVLLAIPFVIYGNANILVIAPPGFKPIAMLLGMLVLFGLCWWFYSISQLQER